MGGVARFPARAAGGAWGVGLRAWFLEYGGKIFRCGSYPFLPCAFAVRSRCDARGRSVKPCDVTARESLGVIESIPYSIVLASVCSRSHK